MQLRARLKQKETVEAENERLKKELSEFKQKQIDMQKKNVQLTEEVRLLQASLAKSQADKSAVKKELSELKRAIGKPQKVGFGSAVRK